MAAKIQARLVLFSLISLLTVQVTAKNKRLIVHQSLVASTVMDLAFSLADKCSHKLRMVLGV